MIFAETVSSCQTEVENVVLDSHNNDCFEHYMEKIMSYEVLARKWRPQQFADVVGQEHVTQTLKNAIESDRIAHAYLFVGPRGIGKTSIARIFAKALNCLKNGPTGIPCDECDSCKEVMAGTSLDVIEIDAASNTGVENVRALRDTVKFVPTRSKFKIFIIDEVHMLSSAAFNALLKTLEEPPPYVKFFFATTEPEKILATIISRCQRFDLRRISVPHIVERLELIAKDDKVKIDSDALLAIARGSEGGLRDAESALDQLISFCGKKITEEDVLAVFGLVSREVMERLAETVLSGEVGELISIIGDLDRDGKDLMRLALELMDHYRNLLVCLNVDDPGSGMELTPKQISTLKKHAKLTNTSRLLRITEILTEAESRMRYTLSRRTLLETSLIRCAKAATVVSLDEILKKINALKSGSTDTVSVDVEQPGKKEARNRAPAPLIEKSRETKSNASDKPAAPPSASRRSPDEELELLKSGWGKIVESMSKVAVGIRGSLLDAQPVAVDGDHVTIGFDAEFIEEMDNFKSPRVRAGMQKVVGRTIGRDISVEFSIKKETKKKSEPKPEPVYNLGESKKEIVAEKKTPKKTKKRVARDWAHDESVDKVLNTFNGSILQVRE